METRGRKPITPSLRKKDVHYALDPVVIQWLAQIAQVNGESKSNVINRIVLAEMQKHNPSLKAESIIEKLVKKQNARRQKLEKEELKIATLKKIRGW